VTEETRKAESLKKIAHMAAGAVALYVAHVGRTIDREKRITALAGV
jgi:hypothetical protein